MRILKNGTVLMPRRELLDKPPKVGDCVRVLEPQTFPGPIGPVWQVYTVVRTSPAYIWLRR